MQSPIITPRLQLYFPKPLPHLGAFAVLLTNLDLIPDLESSVIILPEHELEIANPVSIQLDKLR
jgi:hypothetical protein